MSVRRRAFLVSLAALTVPGGRARAQGDPVDQVVRAEMGQRRIPSVSLTVVKDPGIIKSAAYGRMRLSPDESATPTTIYKLDSVTKQFTASGIMLLVQGGQVRLNEPVRTYLPNAPSSWGAISIRTLLTRTSGLAHDLQPSPCLSRSPPPAAQPASVGAGRPAGPHRGGILDSPASADVARRIQAMADDPETARERRRAARAHWPIVRFRLGEEPLGDLSETTTPVERIAMMWPLAEEAWRLAGRRLPTYDRTTIPARLYRPGESRPDDDDP